MGDGLRWEQRRRVTDALAEELPGMQAAVEEGAKGALFDQIHGLLGEAEDGELIDWVTVAVYRHPDGSVYTSIHSDPQHSTLQIKGLLHDAVWAAAHQE